MPNIGIIVITADRYADVWRPFYFFLEKHWAHCPYPIYHVSETERPITTFPVHHLKSEPERSWTEILSKALDNVPQEYILLLLSDYFLLRDVDSEKIEYYLSVLKREDAAFIRIFPCPGPHFPCDEYPDIGRIKFNTPYSISTQATIWNKNSLKNFILKFKDDSEMETLGSQRSDELEKSLLSVRVINSDKKLESQPYAFTYLCTAVIQGKWNRKAVRLCEDEMIKLDLTYRQKQTILEAYYYFHHHTIPPIFRHLVFHLLPKK